MSAPLSTSHVASSLPVSAATVRIALGSYPGGVAIGTFAASSAVVTASSAVVTALIIAVISIPVAWAAGFLKPPVIADATELAAATV